MKKEKVKNHCKIYGNGKIYFWNISENKYSLFGKIDNLGIIFNIEKEFYGSILNETIPNPSSQFYIELGEYLKKQNNLKW